MRIREIEFIFSVENWLYMGSERGKGSISDRIGKWEIGEVGI